MKIDAKTGRFLRVHPLVEVNCSCGKKFMTSQDRIDEGRGKFCSMKCKYLYREQKTDSSHHMWKGDKVSYSGIHKWVSKYFGHPMTCEWCGFETKNSYQIHWANLSGLYRRDREDWARLCAKCHYALDRRGIHANYTIGR